MFEGFLNVVQNLPNMIAILVQYMILIEIFRPLQSGAERRRRFQYLPKSTNANQLLRELSQSFPQARLQRLTSLHHLDIVHSVS
jgi:hypothetical protein